MLCLQSIFNEQQIVAIKNKHSKVWVAYSGGVDSHVLLNIARQCFNNIHAIHINHQQSEADDIWQAHCIQICAQLNIPLHCVSVNLQQFAAQSMELAARNARRQVWQQTLNAGDLLLLAHHADDQAETILYRMLRGTGPRGLVGMRECSKLGNISLMRPLLSFTKQEILQYAQAAKLQWLEDHSNANLAMDRNFLRQQVMPLLQTRWPRVTKNINRNGTICKQLLQNLDPHLQAALESMVGVDDRALNLLQLKQHNLQWQLELLRAWLILHDLYPSAKHLHLLLQEVIGARQDAQPQLQIGSKFIKRAQNKLYVTISKKTENLPYTLAWNIAQPLALPNGQSIVAEQMFDQQQISTLTTHAITVHVGTIGHKAKKVFQQHAIPPWERHKFPLVFADQRLVGIVGLWSSSRI